MPAIQALGVQADLVHVASTARPPDLASQGDRWMVLAVERERWSICLLCAGIVKGKVELSVYLLYCAGISFTVGVRVSGCLVQAERLRECILHN